MRKECDGRTRSTDETEENFVQTFGRRISKEGTPFVRRRYKWIVLKWILKK